MYQLKIDTSNFQQYLEEIPDAKKVYAFSVKSIEYSAAYNAGMVPRVGLLIKEEVLKGLFFYTEEDNVMTFFNSPIKIFWKEDLGADDQFELYQVLLSFFEKKLENKEITKLSLFFDTSLFSGLQKLPFKMNSYYESFINLSCSYEIIRKGMRRSFRSLINWGNREMKFVRIDLNNCNYEAFDSFREFHIQVSGKETRSKQTWDLQFEMIKQGNAFLELGYLENKLVAGVLILVGQSEAFYGVAVNDRGLMFDKKPIGHAIMVKAIMHAKELGLKTFNLGKTGLEFANEKEEAIAKFKRGLSSEVRIQNFFEVSLESS
ncbi:MAG: hypothetical protein H7336_02705 [Bacteriovorax sp.]|nr:hypothetical protein [Bacteriovorax sp.]